LPENYFAKVPVLPLEYGLGHPVERHPVSDLVDPKDRTHVLVALNCLTCHQPHSSAKPDLLVKDQANNMEFCHSCHKGLIGPEQRMPVPAPGAAPAPGANPTPGAPPQASTSPKGGQ